MKHLIVLLAVASFALAQDPAARRDAKLFQSPLTVEALKLVTPEMQKIMKTHQVSRATFVQLKEMEGLQNDLTSRGEVVYAGNRGVIWRVETPMKMQVVMSAKSLKTARGDSTTSYDISSAQSMKIQSLMQALYQGEMQELTTLFNLFYMKQSTIWSLGLEPKRGRLKRFMKGIILEGNGQGEILRVVLIAVQGGRTTITFTPLPQGHRPLTQTEEKLFAQSVNK